MMKEGMLNAGRGGVLVEVLETPRGSEATIYGPRAVVPLDGILSGRGWIGRCDLWA